MKAESKKKLRVMLIIAVTFYTGVFSTCISHGWSLTKIVIAVLLGGAVLAVCAHKIETLDIQYTVDRHKDNRLEEENGQAGKIG
jgi:uncharacterized membrane protein AbrB (regulator of aidB expression)